jgi:hypothetical protein
MSEYVGASTSRNPKDLHGLYRDNFTPLFKVSLQDIGLENTKLRKLFNEGNLTLRIKN